MNMKTFIEKYGWIIGGAIGLGITKVLLDRDRQEEKLREEEALKQVDAMFKDAFKNRPVAFAVYPDGRKVGIDSDGQEMSKEVPE